MKKLLAASLLLASSAAFAAPHWVEVPTSMNGKVYIDDSQMLFQTIDGENYRGYQTMIVFANAFPFVGVGLTTEYNVKSEILSMMYACSKHIGSAKRLQMTDEQNIKHSIEDVWRVIDHAPATDILTAVKARVCQ